MNHIDFEEQMRHADTTLNSEHIDDIVVKSLKTFDSANRIGTHNLIIVMEELGELIQEISKFLRKPDEGTLGLTEELADCYLGIKYVQKACNISDDDLNKAINIKTDRQAKRIGEL